MTFPDPIGAATPEVIRRLISSATNRLAVLAPAVSMDVASAIEERWMALDPERVSITLDVDAEVYRLGYGDPAALRHLEAVGSRVGSQLQRQRGIRVGIIVADDNTLIYSPTPELIEAGPRDGLAPNAVFIDSVPQAVEKAVGFGERGVRDQTIGLDKATKDEIAEVQQDLHVNPPQKFDVQRQLRVFNAPFQFVELRVLGTNVARRTVRIPTTLLGVMDEQTREDLQMRLHLVSPTDELSGRDLEIMRRRIDERYLIIIPGHGRAIRRAVTEAFLRDVEILRATVDAFKARVAAELDQVIDRKVSQLVDAFLPRLREATPPGWLLPSDGLGRQEALKQCLTEDLRHAFGRAKDHVNDMRVETSFKGVTYESLQDPKFIGAARKAFSKELVPQLYQQFDAARATAKIDN